MASDVASAASVTTRESPAPLAPLAMSALSTLKLARSTMPARNPTAETTASYSAMTSRRATTAASVVPAWLVLALK
jgi:hypothetical protein